MKIIPYKRDGHNFQPMWIQPSPGISEDSICLKQAYKSKSLEELITHMQVVGLWDEIISEKVADVEFDYNPVPSEKVYKVKAKAKMGPELPTPPIEFKK